MRKIALTAACMAIFILSASASEPSGRPVFGVEWEAGLTFHEYHVYNYLRKDGTRLQGSDFQFVTNLNASILFKAGYDLGSRWNVSLITGFEGINDRFRVFPLGCRGTYYFGRNQHDEGSFVFLEPGFGLFSSADKYVNYFHLGYGKRFNLSSGTDLDFSICYRVTNSCPELIDPDEEIVDRLFTNFVVTGYLGISMSLNFQYNIFK